MPYVSTGDAADVAFYQAELESKRMSPDAFKAMCRTKFGIVPKTPGDTSWDDRCEVAIKAAPSRLAKKGLSRNVLLAGAGIGALVLFLALR